MVTRPLIDTQGPGADEGVWARWRASRPELPIHGWRHLVVVAPHPDDEVLGAGGLIAQLRSADIPVTLIAVTDGEASHPGSPTHTPAELAALRIEESQNAAYELATGAPMRLGMRDGGLAEQETELTDLLTYVLSHLGGPGVRCAATWRHDGHPDHEAVGRAAATACADTATELLEYPVWMWHWGSPEHPRVTSENARALPLSPSAVAAKARAMAQHRTQIRPLSDHPADRPVLPAHVLQRFTAPDEVFFQ
ncbi:PIG-L family deacetylase [Nocardia salmonicida]|uniref:PIG-L family deacetylase n=1 Tax=Nocardia salmonicida TaxID=53431 RepID=A0ABZ1N3P6_9NOCA|nr:PIG-L family deacetylase [Nocardia salmonicida]